MGRIRKSKTHCIIMSPKYILYSEYSVWGLISAKHLFSCPLVIPAMIISVNPFNNQIMWSLYKPSFSACAMASKAKPYTIDCMITFTRTNVTMEKKVLKGVLNQKALWWSKIKMSTLLKYKETKVNQITSYGTVTHVALPELKWRYIKCNCGIKICEPTTSRRICTN